MQDRTRRTTAGFAKLRAGDEQDAPSSEISFKPLVQELKATFATGKTKDLSWRKSQLEAIQTMIDENHEEITATVRTDYGGPKLRGLGELNCHLAAQEALINLDKWTAPQEVATPIVVAPTMNARSFVRQEPKGVLLIIGPWNFPFELTLHPLVSAVAAGNCVVIKPSEVSPKCAALLERLINKYLDTSCIKVVQGAVPETTALLKEHWSHIFYTGNGHVGRIVLKAAAEYLTPVTLELGGKSPVIVDKSAKMQAVIERIALSKYATNVGQICVAPDYVIIHKDREEEFITGMKKHCEEDLFGKNTKESPHYGRVINANHVKRIQGLLSQTKGQIVMGSADAIDADSHYIPPTLVRNAEIGEPLLTEEIFGPVLPILTTNNIEDAVKTVNSIDHQPLALYVFSEDSKATDYVLNNTASGGGAVNTTLQHLLNANLPFGGTGASGYGSYHGKAGFDEFTHRRSFLHQDTTIMRGSPIPPKPSDMIYDIIVKATMTGFLSKAHRKYGKAALVVAVLAFVMRLLRRH